MLNTTTEYLNSFKTPSRQITGSIKYIHEGVEYELLASGGLKSFVIERTSPNGKFFGFAVAQKITIEALGVYENIQKGDKLIPSVGIKGATDNIELPNFYVEEINFNKVDKTTTIVGYDIIGRTNNLLIKDVSVSFPISLINYAKLVVEALGGISVFSGISYHLNSAPNFDGSETLQSVLGSIAEASGSICYVQSGDRVKFRALSATVLDTLTTSDYFNFSSGDTVTLTEIASATELGDNYTYGVEGFTQVMRENPFLDLADNTNTILQTIGLYVLNLKGTAYNLDWRGCPAYELGDFIEIIEKDGAIRQVFYLNETLTYNGGLRASSNWETTASERVDGTPATLSKIVGKTYAKVDKINREISLVVEETENLQTEISSLKVEAEGILAEVETTSQKASNALAVADNNMEILSRKVQTAVTSENVSIVVQKEIANGVTAVKTKTGFTFDEDGLTIDKSGSEMTTQITEDGMKVYRDNTEVLVANNKGVEAINLHATTYLTINNLSRFENYTNEYDTQRTGCFWLD